MDMLAHFELGRTDRGEGGEPRAGRVYPRAMRRHRLAGFAVSVLIVVGCNQAVGGCYRYVRTPPEASDLVGVWTPDRESLWRLRNWSDYWDKGFDRWGPVDHQFDLKSDGRCSYRSYTDYSFSDAEYLTPEIFTTCSWNVGAAAAYVHHVRIQVPSVDIELRRGNEFILLGFNIAHEDGDYVLWQFIGDPDYSRYMDFRRAQVPAGP